MDPVVVSYFLGVRRWLRAWLFIPLAMAACGPNLAPERLATSSAAITNQVSFDGIGHNYTSPSGTWTAITSVGNASGAVGPAHYVQMVTGGITVFDKSGTPVFGPAPTTALWAGFGGPCEARDGEAAVAYDRLADRWIVSHLTQIIAPYAVCVAVSQSGDPTGGYARYAFPLSQGPGDLNVAVWPDAYHLTFSVRAEAGSPAGSRVCALDRARMLAGQPATQQCFTLAASAGSLLAASLDGVTPPPAGAPAVVMALDVATTSLNIWKLQVDWAAPASSTFTGPTALPVEAFTRPCLPTGICIPQPGTTTLLEAGGDRLMSRLAYRNFGDHESLVVNHTIAAGSSIGVRWYEIRDPHGTPSIFQHGTFAPDAEHRWGGSTAMNAAGTIAIGYAASSSASHPGLRGAGRRASDPPGVMGQGEGGEGVLFAGTAPQASFSQWNRSSSLTVDPVDDCTFWYTNQYYAPIQPGFPFFTWRTRIATFKVGACDAGAPRLLALAADPITLEGGRPTLGRVTLTAPAPAGGATVAMTSGAPALVTVPATVNVPAGALAATFPISTAQTAPGTTEETAVAITGSFPEGTTAGTTIRLLPSPVVSTLTLEPARVRAGTPVVGTVTLSRPAPAGGAVVVLASSNPAAATIPPTLTVPEGALSGTFPIATAQLGTGASPPVISAALHGSTSTAPLAVFPTLNLGQVFVLPLAVEGGKNATGVVSINDFALPGGHVVSLSSSDGALATVPASVTIPERHRSVMFPVTTSPVAAQTTVTITATLAEGGGTTRTFVLTLLPTTLESLTVAPSTVAGGRPALGIVTLSRPAPAGGFTVALSNSSPTVATVPSTVVVPEGARTQTFIIPTQKPTSNTTVTIANSANQLLRQTTFVVQPDAGNATFDGTLGAPRCAAVGGFCDTGPTAVRGRDAISGGAEPNAPNTLGGSCVDGATGAFHTSQSLDRLRISTVDGTWLATGKQVRVEATVWVTSLANDRLDLFFAPDATNPVWTPIATVAPTISSGQQVLSATFSLPAGVLPALRASWRVGGTGGACPAGATDDRDDLVFASDPGGPDAVPPAVAVAGPANNAFVRRLATVVASADDNVAVTSVELRIDGALFGTDTTPPYTFAVDTTLLGDGAHQLEARAFDAAGNSASSPIGVMIVDNTPPTVAVTSPTNGANVIGSATPTAAASDAGSGIPEIGGVVFFGDYVQFPSFALPTWDSFTGNATLTVTARATDRAGNEAISQGVVVNVYPLAYRTPLVNAGIDRTITLPSQAILAGSITGDSNPLPAARPLTAIWSTIRGPGLVTFGIRTAPTTTARFSTPGTYLLRLTATDGAPFNFDDVLITVLERPADTTPPSVSIVDPADGAQVRGTTTIAVQAVDAVGVTAVELIVDGELSGAVTAPPYLFGLDTILLGDGPHQLQARASDAAGNVGSSAPVSINVNNTSINQRPTVSAGPDQTITLPAATELAGAVTDDGLPLPPALGITWSKILGPGTVTFADPAAPATSASFSRPGLYVLRLRASDGALSASDSVRITVRPAVPPCAGLCGNPTDFTIDGGGDSFQSGPLGWGGSCYQTTSPIESGSCRAFVGGRRLFVNGVRQTCNGDDWPSLPAPRNGGTCIQVTPGGQPWASFTVR
jgi:hypothetical protein